MERLYLKDEVNRILDRIRMGGHFVYLSCPDERNEGLIEKINNLKVEDLLIGIPPVSAFRSEYYWYVTRIDKGRITLNNIFIKNDICRQVIEKSERCFCLEHSSLKLIEKKNAHSLTDDTIKTLIVINSVHDYETVFERYREILEQSMVIIDRFLYGNLTGVFFDTANNIENSWIFEPDKTRFDMAVVCTLFKRPQSLLQQLEAIKQQTLKPRKIYLFQDKPEDREVATDKATEECFDEIYRADRNVGVWGRFRYAKDNVKEKYVCLFDDDTIPGENWLESCHYNMQTNPGIYGAIGVVLTKGKKLYPRGSYYRVGWAEPYCKSVQVDFVGHSWVLETSWLQYMFDQTERYQSLKFVAEDMCLSVKAKEHGIKTYVPPHPYMKRKIWGSIPEFGDRYGKSNDALSWDDSNHKRMNKAIRGLIADGWIPLYKENAFYVERLKISLKLYSIPNLFIRGVRKMQRLMNGK